jgi:hypothetical protein
MAYASELRHTLHAHTHWLLLRECAAMLHAIYARAKCAVRSGVNRGSKHF